MKRIESLEMQKISKKFKGFYANKDVDLTINAGEIIGLLGENGAGKTTLMNILYGLYQADGGTVLINGEPARFNSPKDAIAAGIGMVHQHFMLVQNHTVSENLILGLDNLPFFMPEKKVSSRLKEFSEQYGFGLNPEQYLWQLSAGEQQRVEIVKALMQGVDLLILDEPTSVLTPAEAEDLFTILRKMKSEGHSVVIISHKLEEILSVCDRVVVLRKGEVVDQARIEDVNRGDLARMMIGRELNTNYQRKELSPGEVVLEVNNLHTHNDRGMKAVNGISLKVRQNEVFGIAGVSGNGQRELVEAITGLRHTSEGKISLKGKDITNDSARVISNLGLSHVPEERIRFGIVPNLLIFENSVLKQHDNHPFSNIVFLDFANIKKHAGNIINNFKIAAQSIDIKMKNLSGGNIQKLILGREIANRPDLLVASHPTYGLDVGAATTIRQEILNLRDEGGAVLLVSEDLEELFEICDRIAVIYEGQFSGIITSAQIGKEVTTEDIGLMMTGSKRLEVSADE